MNSIPTWFIAGTDTDVGKTFVSSLIARQLCSNSLRVGVYKPVSSGFPDFEGSDGYLLWLAINQVGTPEEVSPQRFRAPQAPPIAASLEGRAVDEVLLFRGVENWVEKCEILLIEGAGGLLSPISENHSNASFIQKLSTPVILVADWKLGVVNQVLTTLIAAGAMGIRIEIVILNAVHAQGGDENHYKLLCNQLRHYSQWADLPVIRSTHNASEISMPIELLLRA